MDIEYYFLLLIPLILLFLLYIKYFRKLISEATNLGNSMKTIKIRIPPRSESPLYFEAQGRIIVSLMSSGLNNWFIVVKDGIEYRAFKIRLLALETPVNILIKNPSLTLSLNLIISYAKKED
jgi:hypothetical protein